MREKVRTGLLGRGADSAALCLAVSDNVLVRGCDGRVSFGSVRGCPIDAEAREEEQPRIGSKRACLRKRGRVRVRVLYSGLAV